METQEYDIVWDGTIGRSGVYLSALKGFDPITPIQPVATETCAAPTDGSTRNLILAQLRLSGQMTQTQLASACNRSSGDTHRALRRLATQGQVELQQPCLLAIDPRHGQRWQLRITRASSADYLSTSSLALKTLRQAEGPMTRAALVEACGRSYRQVSQALDTHVRLGRVVPVGDPSVVTRGRPARAYRVA